MSDKFTLGLKIKVTGRNDKFRDKIRLECVDKDHNKYYELQYYNESNSIGSKHVVVATYGKMGVLGGTKRSPFGSEQGARKFLAEKIREKKKKGYEEVATHVKKQ